MAIDMDKLQEFLGRFVTDLGATFAAGNVVVGHRLGLYRALATGPASAEELAERTQTSPRYITEWLRGQAAGGYVEYDPATQRYAMTEEQSFALANPDGGVYVPGAFVLALGTLKAEPRITEAFRTGAGMGWHEHDEGVFLGCEQFFRPGYIANLIPSWIPALDDVQDKLQAGARVADIGCGLGASTILLAQEYPDSRFTGLDYHDQSIEIAASGRPTLASRTGSTSRSLPRPVSPAPAMTWPQHSTACTTWAIRSPLPSTSARRSSRMAPGWLWNRTRPTRWPATSTRWGGSTTTPPRICACRTHCPSRAATRSAPRRARRPSGRSPPKPDSPGSAGPRRRRSTSFTRSARRYQSRFVLGALHRVPRTHLPCLRQADKTAHPSTFNL